MKITYTNKKKGLRVSEMFPLKIPRPPEVIKSSIATGDGTMETPNPTAPNRDD